MISWLKNKNLNQIKKKMDSQAPYSFFPTSLQVPESLDDSLGGLSRDTHFLTYIMQVKSRCMFFELRWLI